MTDITRGLFIPFFQIKTFNKIRKKFKIVFDRIHYSAAGAPPPVLALISAAVWQLTRAAQHREQTASPIVSPCMKLLTCYII